MYVPQAIILIQIKYSYIYWTRMIYHNKRVFKRQIVSLNTYNMYKLLSPLFTIILQVKHQINEKIFFFQKKNSSNHFLLSFNFWFYINLFTIYCILLSMEVESPDIFFLNLFIVIIYISFITCAYKLQTCFINEHNII